MIPIFSIVAYSGTGKTTYMEKLIPAIKKRGLKVAVVKHDVHGFSVDHEGKDSDRITKAGADVTGLIHESKSVIMENRPRETEKIFSMITDVDLILTEGYKKGIWPKIMLHRSATGQEYPVAPEKCMAVVSDVKVENAPIQFSFEDVDGVVSLLISKMRQTDANVNPLSKIPFFKNIRKKTLDGLWKDGRIEDVPKKTEVIEAKKVIDYVYIQISGKSMIYNLTHTGNRKVIFIFESGVLLNDHILNEHVSSLYCETLDYSKIFVISVSKFLYWMKRDFELTKSVIHMQEWKMWRMGHQLKNTTSSMLMERKLAAKLWKLSRDFGKETENGIEIDLNLSITFLSDMLGAPRETTSRVCKVLVNHNLIRIDKKKITILDENGINYLYKEGKFLKESV